MGKDEKQDRTTKNKIFDLDFKILYYYFKVFLKSGIVSFILYLFTFTIIVACTEKWSFYNRSVVIGICLSFYFAFSFYLFHTAKSNKNYELTLSTTNPFSIKKEFLSFFMADGKHILTLLIPCMIVEEFFYLLDYAFEIETLVNTFLYFVFPFSVIVIPIPILGTIVSALCFFVLISVFTVFSRYRLYKKWKKSQAEHL